MALALYLMRGVVNPPNTCLNMICIYIIYNYDIQQSIPNIGASSGPGSFAFLDQLMVGQV